MNGINLEVLRDKNGLIIFVSQLVSAVCDKMMSIGLIWYLTKQFGIYVVPWYLVASFLPHLIMAFFSTSIINKIGTLKIVIASEFFRAIVLIVLYFLILIFKIEGNLLLTSLFISGFLVGIGSSLFNPAILSLPPQLVTTDKVAGLNGLIDSSMSISTILGSSVAIFILNFVDLKMLILINGFSFLWAGLLQMGLKPLKNLKSEIKIDVKNGATITPMSVLKKYPEIGRMLASFLFLNLVFTPLLVMIPWFVEKIYRGEGQDLALIEGSMGLGAFLTGLYLSLASFQLKDNKRISMIAIVSFFFGIFYFAFAYTFLTWQGAFIFFSIGALSTFLNIQVLTYFQTSLKEEEVPAIMTAVNIISAASIPLSLSISGLIFPNVYIPTFAKVSGVLIILIALVIPKFLQGPVWKMELK